MGYIFRRFHCALVKIVKVRERTAVAGRSPGGVTGVLRALYAEHEDLPMSVLGANQFMVHLDKRYVCVFFQSAAE